MTGAKPSFAAAIERTPEPQPTSSREPGSSVWRSSSVSLVVGCAPVPNAWPGSIVIVSHGGPTQNRPTFAPWWNSRQRSSQPSGTSVVSTTSKPSGGSSA
jgi:hypothetical protein